MPIIERLKYSQAITTPNTGGTTTDKRGRSIRMAMNIQNIIKYDEASFSLVTAGIKPSYESDLTHRYSY